MTEAYSCVVDLGLALGLRNVGQMNKCWEHQVDDDWWIALNPKPEPIKCSKDIEVPGGNIWIEYRGFPAGIIGFNDGRMVGDGTEDKFIEAVRAATGEAPPKERLEDD